MDHGLVCAGPSPRGRAQSERSVDARASRRDGTGAEQGHQRRLLFVRVELLLALSRRGAAAARGRSERRPSRLSHRAERACAVRRHMKRSGRGVAALAIVVALAVALAANTIDALTRWATSRC